MLARDADHLVPSVYDGACSVAREALLLVIVVYALAHGGDAAAAEKGASEFAPLDLTQPLALSATPRFSLPKDMAERAPAPPDFSATEFSPRKSAPWAPVKPDAALGVAPSLNTTTVWQRMADYRSHDRVRLVTLWESSGSSLSIQAGKRGEPSLQWSSRSLNRGGSKRGLLDGVIASSLGAAAASRLHSAAHSRATALPAPQPTQPTTLLPSLAKAP